MVAAGHSLCGGRPRCCVGRSFESTTGLNSGSLPQVQSYRFSCLTQRVDGTRSVSRKRRDWAGEDYLVRRFGGDWAVNAARGGLSRAARQLRQDRFVMKHPRSSNLGKSMSHDPPFLHRLLGRLGRRRRHGRSYYYSRRLAHGAFGRGVGRGWSRVIAYASRQGEDAAC
jgi:hypothetical protein